MSSQGARGSPERAPRELLRSFFGADTELGDAQENSAEAFDSLEDDPKIKHLDFHETIERQRNSLIFQAPKASREIRFVSKRFES